MDETSGTARTLRAIVATTLVTALVAALMALVGSSSASAAAAPVNTAAGAKTLSSCKQSAVSACRKVTARKCRVTKTKKIRARGDKVNRRKVARSCARVAKRHCKKAAQKRKQAAAAKRCASTSKQRSPRKNLGGASTGPTPTAANTGVPAGTRLKVVRGDLTITRAGTVIDGLDVRGFVNVKASNVTIQNSIIRGGTTGTVNRSLVAAHGGQTGLVIKDTTLRGANPTPWLDGIKGNNFVADRVDVSNVVDTAVVFGDNVAIKNSWLHGNTHFNPDPRQPDNKSHDDNIQIEGGSNILVTNNRIEGSNNAAIMVTQNWGRTSGVRVLGNLMSEGACTMNLAEQGKGPITDFSIADNTFGRSKFYGTTCPMRVPRSSSVSMSGNLFTTNAPANPVMF